MQFYLLPNGELKCVSCLTVFRPEGHETELGYVCPNCSSEGLASDSGEPETD